jgi:hypothetical protein
MKFYLFIGLVLICSCKSNRKPANEGETRLVNDSIIFNMDSSQQGIEASRSLTYEQQLHYITDTITVTTKQNYYNQNYALTLNEFVEDKENAINLLKKGQYLNPSKYKAYQIILALDGKPVLKKLITKHTFQDSLSNIPSEKYYLDKVVYRGVRVNKLFFYSSLRLKERSTDSLSIKLKDKYVEFDIDYLKHIGQLKYTVHQ